MSRARAARTAILLATAAPVIALAFGVVHYGVNVPLWDDWALVPYLQRMDSGALTLSELLAQQQEHRPVFPRLLMLGLARLSGWNLLWEMYASYGMACGIFLLLLFELRRSAKAIRSGFWFWAAPFLSWLVFSTQQYQNWLWGWQLQWYMNVLAVLVALRALVAEPARCPPRLGLAVAVSAGVVATYSLASGSILWLIAIPLVARRPDRRTALPVWGLVAVVILLSYWSGFHPRQESSFFEGMTTPQDVAYRTMTYLGLALAITGFQRCIIGTLVSAVFFASLAVLLARFKARLAHADVWLTVAAYAMLNAIATAAARPDLGFDFVLSNRYATMALLFVAATGVLASLALSAEIERRGRCDAAHLGIGVVLATTLAALIASSYVDGLRMMAKFRDHNLRGKQWLEHAEHAPEEGLLSMARDVRPLPAIVKYLESKEWGGFRREAAPGERGLPVTP